MPAPANDNFASAEALTGASGSTAVTNVDATMETGEPDNAITPYSSGDLHGQTVWYSYTPPYDGTLTLQTHQAVAGSYDTTLEVFTGSTLTGLTLVSSDDDSAGSAMSLLTAPVTGGVTYRIRIDTWNYRPPMGADGTLSWIFTATPPANDNYASRQVIAPVAASVDVPFTLVGATLESGEQHTSGMTGSVWYEVTVPVDKYVLFEVPAGVEVRIYRGTATLAGMLYRNVSNDASRRAFNMGSAFTYWVKLQSATATETGVMHVRPFAWTDWISTPVLQQPSASQYHTTMNRAPDSMPEGWFPTESEAWGWALEGPDGFGYADTGAARIGFSMERNNSGGLGYRPGYAQRVVAWDYAESGGPLATDGRPDDPFAFDDSLVSQLDYATDPVTSEAIQYETADAGAIAAGLGKLQFIAFSSGSTGSQYNTDPFIYDWDFYLNLADPPSPISGDAAWPAPPSSGISTLHVHSALVSGSYVKTVTGGTLTDPDQYDDYDVASLLTGTTLALAVGPASALPDVDLEPGTGDLFVQMTLTPFIDAKIPVQYPRYRIYAPLPAATTSPPLRQVGRPDRSRQYPRTHVSGVRQVGRIP